MLGGVTAFPRGKGGTCLPVWIITCLGKIVITVIVRRPSYISFLFVYQVLELFNLSKFDFVKLVSPTLSMKPWHSLSLSVEMIDTSWDLHCSICLATLLRMLLILLILAWIKSFSTFLIIFLALVVFNGRASRFHRLLGTLQYDLAHYPRGKEIESGSSSGLVGPSKCLWICTILVDQVCIRVLPHPRKDHQNGGYLLQAV